MNFLHAIISTFTSDIYISFIPINPNIYPKPKSPDLMITYEINIECCLIALVKANIMQYYITIRDEDLYLCKVIK